MLSHGSDHLQMHATRSSRRKFLATGFAATLLAGSLQAAPRSMLAASQATPAASPVATPAVVAGTEESPASLNQLVNVESFTVDVISCTSVSAALPGGGDAPATGNVYAVIRLKVTNVTDSSDYVGRGDFAASDPANDDEVDSRNPENADRPFKGGDLDPGEFVEGDLVFEIPEALDKIKLRFRPSLFGDSGYWLLPV
ncbi:MAG TPA: DUF4352 domain-containing protein [Thermomicrobiales bacterium]|nr:DUF4352 domain-containing protein [Thermomicrobiales bacterium]